MDYLNNIANNGNIGNTALQNLPSIKAQTSGVQTANRLTSESHAPAAKSKAMRREGIW